MTERLSNPFKISELVETVNNLVDTTIDDSNLVHKTGNETISGTKIFNTDYTAFKGTNIDVLNNPTTFASVGINYEDINGVVYGQDFIRTTTNGNFMNTKAVKSHNSDNWAELVIGFDANDNIFTSAPTPDTSDNSTKIATTAWVKSQGYMSSSNIFPNNTWVPVGDDAYMGDANHSGAVCFKGNNDNTKLILINRAQNVALGFYVDEGDNNALKLTSPTYSATAWGSVTAMTAQSLSGNGYVKFNHGLIIQWGYSNQWGTSKTVTLPTPFTSTNYAVTTSRYAAEWTEGVIMQTNNYTQTSFNFTANDPGVHWIAIGY